MRKKHFVLSGPDRISKNTLMWITEPLSQTRARIVAADEVHLTLLYFHAQCGDWPKVTNHFVEKICRLPPFSLTIEEIKLEKSCFWLNLKKDDELKKLHQMVAANCPKFIETENPDFDDWRPHITLAHEIPETIDECLRKKCLNFFEEVSVEKTLRFSRFYLTKQNLNSFELLYEKPDSLGPQSRDE